MTATTLRRLAGIKPIATIEPVRTALILIDYQREYFDGHLVLPDAAVTAGRAAELLQWADRAGIMRIHVHHVAARSAFLFAAGSQAVAPLADLAPGADHPVIEKRLPSAFAGTNLQSILAARGITTLILAGWMTHMCVDSTARAALHKDFRVIVASDACTTRDLPAALHGETLSHLTIHAATLAALADRFADILTCKQVMALCNSSAK